MLSPSRRCSRLAGRPPVSREVSLFPARESLGVGEASVGTLWSMAVGLPGYSVEVIPDSGSQLCQSQLLHLRTKLSSVSLQCYMVTVTRGAQCRGAIKTGL